MSTVAYGRLLDQVLTRIHRDFGCQRCDASPGFDRRNDVPTRAGWATASTVAVCPDEGASDRLTTAQPQAYVRPQEAPPSRRHEPHEGPARRTGGGSGMRTSPCARVVRSLCIAAALGIVFLASPPPAGASGTLDQSQEAQTDLNGVALVGSQLAAQMFTAGRQGALDQVDLLLTRSGNPGSLTIEIRTTGAGVPTSQVIASGSVVDTSLDTDPYTFEWVSVALNPAAAVSIGTRYAIVVRDTGGAIFPTDYSCGPKMDSTHTRTVWQPRASTVGQLGFLPHRSISPSGPT